MTRLSVNINKLATLRNSRGGNNPDIVKGAIDCERFGAQGITVHPRPDERHIRYADVLALKKVVKTEFNIEGYPDNRFLELIEQVRPDQVTLVPDPPNALTSNAGWDTLKDAVFLKDVIARLKGSCGRVSVFTGTDIVFISGAKQAGADRVELYTEPYARQFSENKAAAVRPFTEAAKAAADIGVGVNAGHDLNLENLDYFGKMVPGLLEVSIGHALICDAIYLGLENSIQMYRGALERK